MLDKTMEQQNKRVLLSLAICAAAIVIYRVVMIACYLSKIIDDDEALMWYGTVLASHGGIREPHFLGQMYGSMMESIAAVPLYKIGIPLEWALPLATLFLWIFPFVLLAFLTYKKMPMISFCILLSSLLYHWDYDILTNIPRAFISGFPFAFLGLILVTTDREEKPWRLFLGVVLMGLGYLNTVTSIAVSALAILYILLYNRSWLKRDWKYFLSGAGLSALILYYCNHVFYENHPDYWVFGEADQFDLSWDVFLGNIKMLREILCSFSLMNYKGIPVCFLLCCLLVLVCIGQLLKHKDYRFLSVIVCAILGSGLFMMVSKTHSYDDSLWYSAARLYLYFPYVIIAVLYLYARKSQQHLLTERRINYKIICNVFVCLVLMITVFKVYHFTADVINYNKLYEKSTVINIYSVEDIYRLADEISDVVEENETDIVISINHIRKDGKTKATHTNKGIDYATSAINYGKYLEYRTYFDRRTDVYLQLKDRILHNEKVTFLRFEDNQIAENYTRVLDDTDCITYLENKTGLYRTKIKVQAPK